MKRIVWGAALSAVGLTVGSAGPVQGAPLDAPPPEECFIVADGRPGAVDGEAEDLLTRVARSDPDPATNETDVGTGTGTFNMEAIALQPGTGVLFAADAGRLGTVDLTSGRFTEIGVFGTATGALGERTLKDIDGLGFDATTGYLYGTERVVPGEDLLVRIDPASGAVVPAAIAGADYAVIPAVADLPDIDDIAVDPVDGQMYAVANDDGRRDHLVRIDKTTGETTDIGVMQAQDVEGLGFASGQLIGTTGKNFKQEGIWGIDKTSGAADNRRPLDNGRDYEGFDCLNPPNPVVAPEPPPLVAAPSPPPPVILGEETTRGPAAIPAPEPPPVPQPAAELPRTGPTDTLMLVSGISLALGGIGVLGGTRSRRRRRRR